MGIELTEEEIQELKDHLPVDGESFDINIPLSKTLDMRPVSGLEWLKIWCIIYEKEKKNEAFSTAEAK